MEDIQSTGNNPTEEELKNLAKKRCKMSLSNELIEEIQADHFDLSGQIVGALPEGQWRASVVKWDDPSDAAEDGVILCPELEDYRSAIEEVVGRWECLWAYDLFIEKDES